MKKLGFGSFIKNFLLANLFSILMYLILVFLVHHLTGGAVLKQTEFGEMLGYGSDAVDPVLAVVARVLVVVIFSMTFVFFYAFNYWRLARNEEHRSDFLRYIDCRPFDRVAFRAEYMKKGNGRTQLIYFSIMMGVAALSVLVSLGPLEMLFTSHIVPDYLMGLIFGSSIFTSIVSAVLVFVVNVGAYYLYQSVAVVHMYEKWASTRLRIKEDGDCEEDDDGYGY